ncbi:MAG: hypothetical protein LUE96_03710 [Lachnospiraceae bacterium]|nr:hypothetical protein [Lachnospiraceae bacterium]
MKADIYYLSAMNGVIIDDKLIMVNMLYGIVLEYDLKDFNYTILGYIKLPEEFDMVRVTSIIPYDGFLYMTLENAHEILRFSRDTKEICVPGGTNGELRMTSLNRSKAYLHGDVIWSLPYDCSEYILRYDIRSDRLENWKSIEELLTGEDGWEKDFIVDSCLREGRYIYLVIRNTDMVIVIDMDLESIALHHIGKEYHIKCIERLGEDLSLTVDDGNFFLRLKEDCSVEKISYEYMGISPDAELRTVFMDSGRYVAVMSHDPVVYMLDENTKALGRYDFSEGFRHIINEKRACILNLIQYENYLYYIPFSMNCIVRINLDLLKGEKLSGELRRQDVFRYYRMERLKSENAFWAEGDDLNLGEYLEYVACSIAESDKEKAHSQAGELIYHTICN